jgi:hypothetical protein
MDLKSEKVRKDVLRMKTAAVHNKFESKISGKKNKIKQIT